MDKPSNAVGRGNRKETRADSTLKEKRVLKIFSWIIQGYSMRKILFQLISDENDLFKEQLTERQIDNYIADARALMKEKLSEEADYEKNLALNRLEGLFTMNYKIQDFRECRMTVMDKAKLLGIVIEKQETKLSGGLNIPNLPDIGNRK